MVSKKSIGLSVIGVYLITSLLAPFSTFASVANWQQSLSVIPMSKEEFGSESFKQSMRDARDTGANYISLVIPYSQTNIYSTDVHPTWNTPNDAAVYSAINYIHSLGLKVALNLHVEVDTGDWRAYINPEDRSGWFQSYGNFIKKYAGIGKSTGAEQMIIGSELISMTNKNVNASNTGYWNSLIAEVRGIYSGTLVYSANRGGDWFYDEKNNIEFWDKLDYLGMSPYYPLWRDNNRPVDSQKEAWDNIRWNDIEQFHNRFGKDILFTEIGYRSAEGSYQHPYDYWTDSNASEDEQAIDYEALLSYWNNVSYLKGINIWNWKSDPNSGGAGNKEYTPQNKKGEETLRAWFSAETPTTPPASQQGAFTSDTSVDHGLQVNQSNIIRSTIHNVSGATSNLLMDFEIYDRSGNKVLQKYFDNESIARGQSKTFEVNWTPTIQGDYTYKLGVFNTGWNPNFLWKDTEKILSVVPNQGGTTPPPTSTSTPTQNGNIEIWWPTDNGHVSGIQPLKAMLKNNSVENYKMFWQVDNDRLNEMQNNYTDYPHKETQIDFTGWNWKGSGTYNINFVTQDMTGHALSTKAINIFVN